ncbi:phenylalanine--tRNA ligase subunit beta [Granulicella tundricola]|uniref:Phenylalanine--tRNA ligase beta subunit n=1 Tax=Granulicella tundricola (strain ATCC BAA-1859 / DSM 23138 / MP5ACTX9) TaxID=1198114 RepID=E8X4U9_GRATM|nr:phenylalanine--tRNA ligase subunit beta [Granulicella tundricola]ADW70588.1 phenylalanyl-tRNA synthetase, beta subunit [Granulicella tundricola MP5ACTX9]
MKILTPWLRSYLPVLAVDDAQLAEDLTLRGIAVEGVFEVNDASGDSEGSVFDMDITTNRVDAMNHYGMAREVAAIYDLPLHALDVSLPDAGAAETAFPVRIEAQDLCGRFTARVLRGVTVAPTDGVIGGYFDSLGLKKISNAVDVTNYVLQGMGHPTHAFDLDKIEGGIVVRRAKAGEQIKLLDGTTRTLVVDDLVVADEVKALGLAGVMGGWDSMITAETKNVLVEAAWFQPATIRASSRRHLIHTDASHRFERGADFAAAPIANALVSKLILEACGGRVEGELIDVVVAEHEAATANRGTVALSVTEARRHLGTTVEPDGINAEVIHRYLTALGCTLTPVSVDGYEVRLPSWRLDLTREIDLIEEIARVYGYNGFANTLPTPGVVIDHPTARAERAVRERLLALGYSEALSSTFASAAESAQFAAGVAAVELENPLNEEAANLRPSLLPGMVTMLAHNLNRDVLNVRLFETGAVFSGGTAEVSEAMSLSLGITGVSPVSNLYLAADASFYELKGAVESLVGLFAAPGLTFAAEASPVFEAGRAAAASVNGKVVAQFGQLAASEGAKRKMRQPVYVATVDLAALLAMPLKHTTAKELSRFQAVERDFSFVFANSVTWGDVEGAIRSLKIAELQSLRPIEVFRDEKKWPGVYSTLMRTVFQSLDRTLTDEDVTGWWSAIISALQGLGGVIRDS